jgi:hypothetical protein
MLDTLIRLIVCRLSITDTGPWRHNVVSDPMTCGDADAITLSGSLFRHFPEWPPAYRGHSGSLPASGPDDSSMTGYTIPRIPDGALDLFPGRLASMLVTVPVAPQV